MKLGTKKQNNREAVKKTASTSYLVVKRIADIIFSSIILLITSPVVLTLIALIKLESKGSAFYIQQRVGRDGKVFNLYKLRTMFENTEQSGGGLITLENDPRITKVGKLIRWCSLDEFPQFFNVLIGDMSYIGPRPISVDEHNFVLNYLKKKNKPIPQGLIHKIKPAITGWALLHGREKISYEDRFKLNAEYENNLSMWFDLKIFYLTFKKYLFTNLCVLGLFLIIAALITIKII